MEYSASIDDAEKSFENLQQENAQLRKLVDTAPLGASFMIGFILGALLMFVTLGWLESSVSQSYENDSYSGAVM